MFNLYKGTDFMPAFDMSVFFVCLFFTLSLKSTWFGFSLYSEYFFSQIEKDLQN